MKFAAACLPFLLVSAAAMAEPAVFSVKIKDIENDKPIPPKYAFCQPDGAGKTKDGGNVSPEVSWSGAPAGTKSFALVVVDPDVPAVFTDANQEGKVLAKDMPRQNFYHWVLVDIPVSTIKLEEGVDSKEAKKEGKPLGKTAYGINGQNDYASFMKGEFGGYDGSCPPWNDERLHHYHFTVYALGTESLGLSGKFGGKEAMDAINKHKLASAEVVGTYTNKQ
jgi:Raf kinase inhibitor-like YbhB/YbcL family protein